MDDEPIDARAVSAEAIAGVLRRRADVGGLWVPLEGSSMLPTISAGAEGLLAPRGRPRPGEVWAFVDSDGSVTVHRVLNSNREGLWVMRGDGADKTDIRVPLDALVGKVVAVRREGEFSVLGRSRLMALRLQMRRVQGRLRWWWAGHPGE